MHIQVLYDVVLKANNGEIDFEQAIKIISDDVQGAGELVAMQVMAVLTLTGNCVNRDFLRKATLSESCKKHARERMFPNLTVSPSQMKTALNGVVRRLGLSEYIVENLLCEAVRPRQGFDTFHPSQSITFLDSDSDNIVCVKGGTSDWISVEDDRKVLERLPNKDRVTPLYEWWQATKGREGIHQWFVERCKADNIPPESLVIRPHLKAAKNLSEPQIWEKYMQRLRK